MAKTISSIVKQLAKKKKKGLSYKDGDGQDKVWINFQITKDLKRRFRAKCEEKNVNASEYIRKAMELLIEDDSCVNLTQETNNTAQGKAEEELSS